MIVVDASVVIEVLLCTPRGVACASRLLGDRRELAAPHLLDVEVAQVLRRYERESAINARRAAEAVEDLADLPILRYRHDLLISRVWALRHSISAYDAAYVALAEALDAPLFTYDSRLARSSGHQATIEIP